jgi:DNA-directed RNA polymerase specialized sigma24 family protein
MSPSDLYRAARVVVRSEARRWPEHLRADIEQDIWAALLAALPACRDDGHPQAWIARVVAHEGSRAHERQRLVQRPRRWSRHEQRVAEADAKARARHGRDATREELADDGLARLTCPACDREPASLDDGGDEHHLSLHERLAAPTPDPEREHIEAEDAAAALAAVDSLVGPYRAALVEAYGLDGGGDGGTGDRASTCTTGRNYSRCLCRAIGALRVRIHATM